MAKTLWRGLTMDGIWQKILKDKYLPSLSVSNWFRLENSCFEVSSSIWKNLQKSKPLLDHWLCWEVGIETSIQVGRDLLMGLGRCSILSPSLQSALKHRGILFLFQVRNSPTISPTSTYWKDVTEMALTDDQSIESKLYK